MPTQLVAFALVTCSLLACSAPPPPPAPPPPAPAPKGFTLDAAKLALFAPLPELMGDPGSLTDAKVQLGRLLFHDPRLSMNGKQSCNTCHSLATFGVDNQPTSAGAAGKRGDRNSPTVFNAAGHFVQFWDGRAATVEEQAKGPILNPVEMGMKDDKAVVAAIQKVKGYANKFAEAFPGEKVPITFDHYAKAVGAFERKLTTPSRFDAFLKGDKAALTEEEQKGLVAFVDTGCMACHNGALLGGQTYQKLGLVKPWPSEKDLGRAAVTKNAADKLLFKVPSLRNVEKTAPYLHDGSVATLEEAVKLMGSYQLGRELNASELKSITTFLKTLTGTPPAALIEPPTQL